MIDCSYGWQAVPRVDPRPDLPPPPVAVTVAREGPPGLLRARRRECPRHLADRAGDPGEGPARRAPVEPTDDARAADLRVLRGRPFLAPAGACYLRGRRNSRADRGEPPRPFGHQRVP